jgi:hypothetical protein
VIADTYPVMSGWSPLPLAEAILDSLSYETPPLLALAAYKCKHLGDCERLTELAYAAAAEPEGKQ